MPALASGSIQGLLRYGYAELRCAAFMLLTLPERAGARVWLKSVLDEHIATADERKPKRVVNLAFTHGGLAKLGLEHDTLQTFPAEFSEGMAGNPYRSACLGDVGQSAPSTWSWGGDPHEIDAILLLYAGDSAALDRLVEHHRVRARDFRLRTIRPNGGMKDVLETLTLPPREEARKGLHEHFGFRDGLAQPAVRGWHDGASRDHLVHPGEFVLGYQNEYGAIPHSPRLGRASAILGGTDFGLNGSYLVLRQLEQDVQGFWRFALAGADGDSDKAIELAAKMVGRWPQGTPLLSGNRDVPYDAKFESFRYKRDDPAGEACPLGAHIRRSNPRDALPGVDDPEASRAIVNRHRILRRGRPYGVPLAASREPADMLQRLNERSGDRGLYFLCLNASIARQFEFIQHNWLISPSFVRGEQDPLCGDRFCGMQPAAFTAQGQPLRHRMGGLARFIHVRGGAYFFLPSIQAMRYLAQR